MLFRFAHDYLSSVNALSRVSCLFCLSPSLSSLPGQVMHGIGLKAIGSERGGGGPEVKVYSDRIGAIECHAFTLIQQQESG